MNVLNIIMQSTQFEKMNDNRCSAESYTEQYDDLKNYLTLTKDDTTKVVVHQHNSSSSSSSTDSDSNSGNAKSNDTKVEVKNKNEWNQNTDGTWSFINSNGEKATGWIQDGNTWYYLNSSGIMQTGWFKDTNGLWYYLNPNGSMKTGWLKDTRRKMVLLKCKWRYGC